MLRNHRFSTGFLIGLIIMLCVVAAPSAAMPQGRITMTPLSTLPKIPSREVTFTMRDSEGYMWYGCNGIVGRDDGYNVVAFPIDGASHINEMAEDSAGRIWIGADNGCHIIDKTDYTVKKLDDGKIGDSEVSIVRATSDGSVWLSTKGELHRYAGNSKWGGHYNTIDRSGNPTTVSGFVESRNGDILITTFSRGVYRYDIKGDRFYMYSPTELNVSLGKIIQDQANDYYWVSDHQGMVYRFDPSAPAGTQFKESLNRNEDVINTGRRVRTIGQDNVYGFLWITTRSGITVLRPDADGYLHPVENIATDEFEGALITSLCIADNRIWVFCYDKPNAILDLNENSIENNRLEEVRTRYGDYPVIEEICPDPDSNLIWMIQLRSGLILYDRTTGRISDCDRRELVGKRLHQAQEIAPSGYLKGIWSTQKGSLKIYGIVHDQAMNINVVDSVSLAGLVSSAARVTRLYESVHGKLWIGTTEGLFRYDLRTGRFDQKIKGIKNANGFVKKGKTLWVIDNNGLYAVTDGQQPKRHSVHEAFTAMTMAPDARIWLGTKSGRLLMFNPKEGYTKDYTSELQHKGNEIKQLYVDKFGHVWVVTDQLVTQFNPRNRTHHDYEAGYKDKLNAYMSSCNFITRDEEIVVGGIGGLAIFTPSNRLDVEIEEPSTKVTEVRIDGRSTISDYAGSFDNGRLILNPDSRNIEIFFSTLDQSNARNERFAYRIKGVDKDWNYTQPGENRAFYNSIPSGRWQLEVRACDENNYWSGKVNVLEIDSKTPFYASWWAILIYVALAVAILAYALYQYSRYVNKENEKMWTDSKEMVKMREYLQSPVTLPQEEFRELDRVLLEKATKVVEANISAPDFGVVDLASGVNMSKSSLARKLKAITGKTPLDFIRQIKMQHACRLLESQNHTVAEVADMVGFEDRRYFTTSFKKEVGVTPSAYVKGERASSSDVQGNASDETDEKNDSLES